MKGTIRFNLRTDKILKDGKVPIELVYSIKNQRKYFNTGEKIFVGYWDSTIQRAKYIPLREAKKLLPLVPQHSLHQETEIEEVNDALDGFVRAFSNIEKEFMLKGIQFSSDSVMQVFKAYRTDVVIKQEPKNFLFDFISQYIETHVNTRALGSLSVYKALGQHLKGFEEVSNRKVRFSEIDYDFFQKFQNYLLAKQYTQKDGTVRRLQNTTIAKQLSTLKTFLNYASRFAEVKMDKSRYDQFRIKREQLEVIALTQEEFDSLYFKDLTSNPRLAHVRDVFCFSCVTGLRYSDLEQLSREHIKDDAIVLTVTKTKRRLRIPLVSFAKEILEKYSDMVTPLPIISSQKLNVYVKELCKLCEIDDPIEVVRYRGSVRDSKILPKYELIHVHTGRKTFATLSLEKGMSAEEVMSITGHTDYRSFSRYVTVTEKRKDVVMKLAWGEVRHAQLKVV